MDDDNAELKIVNFDMYLLDESHGSYCLSIDGASRVWVRKSLVRITFVGRNFVNVSMPEWLAYARRLITGDTVKAAKGHDNSTLVSIGGAKRPV